MHLYEVDLITKIFFEPSKVNHLLMILNLSYISQFEIQYEMNGSVKENELADARYYLNSDKGKTCF